MGGRKAIPAPNSASSGHARTPYPATRSFPRHAAQPRGPGRREPAPAPPARGPHPPGRKRPPLRARDKLLWVLARRLCTGWRRHLVVVRPETVVRWHRRGWRLFWRWRSRCPLGRPRLSAEVRELIATMARENPAGAPNASAASCSSWASPSATARSGATAESSRPARRARRWRTFLANHRRGDLGGRPVHRPDADVPHARRARRSSRTAGGS